MGPRNALLVHTVGLVRILLNMSFLSVHHAIPRHNFWDYLRQVLTLDALEAFRYGSILDKSVFSLSQKQGMLVNDQCSSWNM